MREELILILVIGIVVPILFTPIIIDAVESNYGYNQIVVEFSYPKNITELRTEIENKLLEDFSVTKDKFETHTSDQTSIDDMVVLTDELDYEPEILYNKESITTYEMSWFEFNKVEIEQNETF